MAEINLTKEEFIEMLVSDLKNEIRELKLKNNLDQEAITEMLESVYKIQMTLNSLHHSLALYGR